METGGGREGDLSGWCSHGYGGVLVIMQAADGEDAGVINVWSL